VSPDDPATGTVLETGTLAALRQPGVVRFVASRFFSGAGQTLLRATFAWQVFQLTGSAFHLGLVGLVQFVPTFFLSLVGGAVADSFERRRILILAQTATLAGSATLGLLTQRGEPSLPLVYGVVFAVSCALAFEAPARQALLPTLVPRLLFPSAVTVNSTVQQLGWVTGPVVMGFVIDAFGVAAAYAAHVSLVLVSLVNLAGLPPPRGAAPRRDVSLRAIREGIAFVRSRQAVLGAMALDMFAVIFGSVTALLPIYANEILGVGARGYGLLASALEIGSLSMAAVLILLPPIRRAGPALCSGVAVYGLATIVFGLSASFPLSLAALIVAGAGDQVSVVMRSTLIQLATPDALRGRVSSLNFIFIGASNQLGAVESGFVAALTSAVFAVTSGGVACLAVLGLIAWKLPELRRYRLDHPHAEPDAQASARYTSAPPSPGGS
jgi:MFS family permease